MDNTISVVMPTYNSEPYIKRTLDTVYQQSFLPYEIVIVDDGSSDRTVKIIKDYIRSHKNTFDHTRVIKQENRGAGAARNRAVKESSGDWIAFLDSDDIWDKDKLKTVYEVIKNHPEVNMVAHDEYSVNETNLNDKKLCPLHENYNNSRDLFDQLYEGNIFSTSTLVIKKEVIRDAGGFDESLRSAQDYDLWIRCGMYGKLLYLDKPLETYVSREGNITSNTYRRYKCEMKIARKYIPELKKKHSCKETKKIVRKRIFNIHKVEVYLSLKQKKIGVALNIIIRLPAEYLMKV